MSLRNENAFRLSFKLVCMIGVLSMVGYWFYKFLVEDRDIGVVDYEPLGTSEIDHPVASICIVNPFLGRKINIVEPQHNETTYLAYIKGDIDAPELQGSHYENLTLDLNDYLTTVAMAYLSRAGPKYDHIKLLMHNPFLLFIYPCFLFKS